MGEYLQQQYFLREEKNKMKKGHKRRYLKQKRRCRITCKKQTKGS